MIVELPSWWDDDPSALQEVLFDMHLEEEAEETRLSEEARKRQQAALREKTAG
jgi:hypothetical protein